MAPFKFSYSKEFFQCLQFSFYFFSLCLLYSLFNHLHNTLAVNLPGSSLENSFLLSSSSYHLTSSVFSLYFLSNSSTSSFIFPKFSLLSQVSLSTVYPFHHTKNFSFSLTILLFSILSTSNFFFPLIMTSFGGVFFYSFI